LYFRLTRPDALQSILQCAKFSSNPGPEHWKAAIRVLKYLGTTRDQGLEYTSSGKSAQDPWKLEVYVDADHGGDLDTRKSRMGYIILLNGNIVSFASRMESRVTISTTMAEYIALSEAMKELIWIKNVVQEMGLKITMPLMVYEDNQT